MHGPVDGEVSRSSRIRPSIAATLARRAPTSRSDRCGSRCLYHGGVPLAYWLPPALWMAAIMVFSSDVGSAQHTAHWLVPLLRLMAPSATPSQLAALHGPHRRHRPPRPQPPHRRLLRHPLVIGPRRRHPPPRSLDIRPPPLAPSPIKHARGQSQRGQSEPGPAREVARPRSAELRAKATGW